MPVAPEIAVQIVRGDEKDVKLVRGGLGGECSERAQSKQNSPRHGSDSVVHGWHSITDSQDGSMPERQLPWGANESATTT
jgi:hypothetical protein